MPTEGLDPAALANWITGLDLEVTPPLAMSRIGEGNSNLTYLITDADGRRFVARRPPLGRLLPSAHDVAREHRILSALQTSRVPVPAVWGFAEPGTVTDAPLLLMQHVDGSVMGGREGVGSMSVAARTATSQALVETLARIHDVDLAATGLLDLASHESYAQRQLKRWKRQWDESRTRDLDVVDEIHARLAESVPPHRGVSLIHGDYHLSNVIIDPARGQVAAVLDWELSTLGDPVADLGGLLAYWGEPGESPTAAFPLAGLDGMATRRDLVGSYAVASGRDVEAIGFWFVLALWKVGVILEGVRRRSLDDERNMPARGLPSIEAIDEFFEKAREELSHPRL